MRSLYRILFWICCGFSVSVWAEDELNLMPYPQQMVLSQGQLLVGSELSVKITGAESPRVQPAVARFVTQFERQAARPLSLNFLTANSKRKPLLHIDVASDAAEILTTPLLADESYRLAITEKAIVIQAETTLGALHALQTLAQLLHTEDKQYFFPLIEIADVPRFKWRGALLDVSRNFFSIDTLKRQIDGMAAAKLNVFHWHLTDDQGWRMESKRFPLLQQQASGGQFYTQVQIRELVDYAWQRGIQVLPEIDMPGHVSALAQAYPELMSAPGPYAEEIRWGVHKPTLNPANPAVYEFIDLLMAEVTSLFPFSYVHIGGDEVDPAHWLANPAIQTYMREQQLTDHHALQASFNRQVEKIMAKHQRKIIGWDEILHPDLSRDIVIQSWRGPDALGEAVQQGFQGLLSTGFYLDQPQSAAYHYRNELMPEPFLVDDMVRPGETWQSWSFVMPRKRGSAIRGQISIIYSVNGQPRGFIDFAGKSRRALNNLKTYRDLTLFELDTWMGPISSRLTLQDSGVGGSLIVGNVHYPVTGKKIAGSTMPNTILREGIQSQAVPAQAQSLILGGELALWAELVNEDVIDLRLWPRAFVVGERLWSAAERRDEASLYRRLKKVSTWSAMTLGLQHLQQQRQMLQRLAPQEVIEPLLILSEALEPAQYYHRQHEKSAHASYSRRDPLNLFVDSLPAESVVSYELHRAINIWLNNRTDLVAKDKIYSLLTRWLENDATLQQLMEPKPDISLSLLVQRVKMVSQLGLYLLTTVEQGKNLTEGEAREARALLYDAQQMEGEVVVAAAYAIEQLLMVAFP